MKAIVFEGPERIAVRDLPAPQAKAGQVLIRVSHAGICGSDMTIYWGKHPRAEAPLVPGHEFSGTIASEHPTLPVGTMVTVYPYLSCGTCAICAGGGSNTCATLKLIGIDIDGGMAEYVAVPNDSVYAVPDGVSPSLAAFVEPVGIAVHAMRYGGCRPGDRVALFGAGSIGLAVALTLRQYGAGDLMICEPNPARRELAKSMGFDVIAPEENTLEQIYARTEGMGADCVYDCAGHQSVADILPDAVRINGRIVIVAGYKTPPVMNFQKGMMREFSIQFVRNCTRKDFEIARDLVGRDGSYEKLLNCILPIDEALRGFDAALNPKDAIKVMFCMG